MILGPDPELPREVERNEPCWCGSSRKYKLCHMDADEQARSSARAAACRGAT